MNSRQCHGLRFWKRCRRRAPSTTPPSCAARLGPDVLWLDPTASEQGGTLAKTAHRADFEYALVIDPDTAALEPMPRTKRDASFSDVRLSFNLTAWAWKKPATCSK